MIGVAILGSTGSVGEATLDVIARHPDRFRVVALGAHRNVEKLAEQCRRFSVSYAALATRVQIASYYAREGTRVIDSAADDSRPRR